MGRKFVVLAGAGIAATAASAQPAGQKVTGPVAVYWMSAATQSGMGMGMGAGAGGRPSVSQMMNAMNGGAQHSLVLQLGSTEKPTAAPDAEHLPPQGLGVGATLPLVTPEAPPPTQQRAEEPERPSVPQEYQRPKGRMLIFWGCGEHAKPGQPVVIDFAQMSAGMSTGKMPAGMEILTKSMVASPMRPPSAQRYPSYGEWPNAKARTSVPSGGSLVGEHTIHGDYSPEIRFNISQSQDFLGPLTLTTNTKTPGGPAQLGWASVSGAEAYAATVIGTGKAGADGGSTMVLWSSSEISASFSLPDYISSGDLARGVESHALMGAETTSCAVPKEVVDAAPQGFLQMVAYGREANFVYPPRPTDPKITWNQQWQVKVRYRSATGGLLGMNMPQMGGRTAASSGQPGGAPSGDPSQAQAQQQQQSPQDAAAARRKAILQGLGSLIPH